VKKSDRERGKALGQRAIQLADEARGGRTPAETLARYADQYEAAAEELRRVSVERAFDLQAVV
jgi:hypothetical protein